MGNKIGVYGVPEMLERNGRLVVKYPTEKAAADRLLNPNAPRFVEAPGVPLLECHTCEEIKPYTAFDQEKRNTLRLGRHTDCKACRSKKGKAQRLIRIFRKGEPISFVV